MSEEKNIDFCELRNLVYEITDLNESAIAILEKVNITESNKVITVLKCNEKKNKSSSGETGRFRSIKR